MTRIATSPTLVIRVVALVSVIAVPSSAEDAPDRRERVARIPDQDDLRLGAWLCTRFSTRLNHTVVSKVGTVNERVTSPKRAQAGGFRWASR